MSSKEEVLERINNSEEFSYEHPKLSEEDLRTILSTFKIETKEINELYQSGHFFINPLNFKRAFLTTMSNIIQEVFEYESDLYIINIGREGTGKSLFSIWATYWLKRLLKNEELKLDEIALTHEEWLIGQEKIKENFLIHDEAVDTFSALEFQSVKGRNAMEIAIRNRASQIINILNIPSIKYVHPYIRDERMDMIWINTTVYTKDGKRVFLKFIFDKPNSLKLIEYLLKNPGADKKKLIGRSSNRKLFDFIFGGVFWVDVNKDASMKIFSKYKKKKKLVSSLTNFQSILREVSSKNKTILLRSVEGGSPIFLFYLKLIGLINKFVLRYFSESKSFGLNIFLDIQENSKKGIVELKKKNTFYYPLKFVEEIIDLSIIYESINKITEGFEIKRSLLLGHQECLVFDFWTTSTFLKNAPILIDKYQEPTYIDAYFSAYNLLKSKGEDEDKLSISNLIEYIDNHEKEVYERYRKIVSMLKEIYLVLSNIYTGNEKPSAISELQEEIEKDFPYHSKLLWLMYLISR